MTAAVRARSPRRASKSERTRTRILDAAASVLSSKGYAGTRLGDIAAVAELQAPAIYYYFSSREELIEEVVWVGLAGMREHLAAVLAEVRPGTTAVERIMVAVETHLRHELALSDYTTAVIRNAGQLPERLRERQHAEERRYGDLWRILIADAAGDGALDPELDPHITLMLVMGALNWAAEWWSPQRGSLDAVVAVAQAFVRNALTPPPTG